MDLYELVKGYDFSFGLYSENFSDSHRKRSPKLSAHCYSAFLSGNITFLGSQGITQLQRTSLLHLLHLLRSNLLNLVYSHESDSFRFSENHVNCA